MHRIGYANSVHTSVLRRIKIVMEKVKPRTLSGFMELLPAPQVQMERIMQVLRETYALYGFYPLDTPLIESSEVLLAKGGGETESRSTASPRATAICPCDSI